MWYVKTTRSNLIFSQSFASLYVNRTCSDHTALCFEDLFKLICDCDNGTYVFGASSILLGGYANLTAEQVLSIEMEDAEVRYLTALTHDLQHNAASEEPVNETSSQRLLDTSFSKVFRITAGSSSINLVLAKTVDSWRFDPVESWNQRKLVVDKYTSKTLQVYFKRGSIFRPWGYVRLENVNQVTVSMTFQPNTISYRRSRFSGCTVFASASATSEMLFTQNFGCPSALMVDFDAYVNTVDEMCCGRKTFWLFSDCKGECAADDNFLS